MLAGRRAFPTIPAKDFDRAKAWYRDKLELAPAHEDEMGAIYKLADGTVFLVFPTSFAGTAQNTAMSFVSPDVPADVAALRSHGVVFEDYDMPGLKTVDGIATIALRDGTFHGAWFKDSEGNILSISELPPGV